MEKKWSYWDSYWSFVEWTIILTSISAVGFYLYKVDKSVSVSASIPLHCQVLKDLKNGSKPDVLFELVPSFVDTTIPL